MIWQGRSTAMGESDSGGTAVSRQSCPNRLVTCYSIVVSIFKNNPRTQNQKPKTQNHLFEILLEPMPDIDVKKQHMTWRRSLLGTGHRSGGATVGEMLYLGLLTNLLTDNAEACMHVCNGSTFVSSLSLLLLKHILEGALGCPDMYVPT